MGSSDDRGAGAPERGTTLQDVAALAAWKLARELLVAVVLRARSVGALADDIALDVTGVSRCLRALSRAGVLAYDQEGHRHVYSPGPRLAVAQTADSMTLTLTAGSGARVTLEIPAPELAELRRFSAAARAPGLGAGIVVRPGPAREPRGHAPTGRRQASEP